MKDLAIINYQGSKAGLLAFIADHIANYIEEGDGVLDLFSGSGAVTHMLRTKYRVLANDAELFASIIAASVLELPESLDPGACFGAFRGHFDLQYAALEKTFSGPAAEEVRLIAGEDSAGLERLYAALPNVWNARDPGITPEALRQQDGYNLFCNYYAGSYFGLAQAMEIDAAVYAIRQMDPALQPVLYSCLFFAMKETVFSKDGHMAQPLSMAKYPARHIRQRKKNLLPYFRKKLAEYGEFEPPRSRENQVFNLDFARLLEEETLPGKVSLIYADPPYTDMQYSRYYHLLNIAARYDYPALTATAAGYTKGLYTQGRNQSALSQKGEAKKQLRMLFGYCAENGVKLALSFAYPQNTLRQATDRYTVTIEELVHMAKEAFGHDKIEVKSMDYKHSNNRNSAAKNVIEYLILGGEKKEARHYSVERLKSQIAQLAPTNKNALYNSHLYWSQKSYNICEALIRGLSEEGDIVFDPFLGSGVTVLEAVKKGVNRIGIGCEINEMPLFIPRTLLHHCFLDNLNDTLDAFARELAALQVHYRTTCPQCGGDAHAVRVVFDKLERTGAGVSLKVVNYRCDTCGKGNKTPDKADCRRMNVAHRPRHIQDIRLLQNSKIAVGEGDRISDLFTKRNFMVLDQVLAILQRFPQGHRQVLTYLLMSVLHLCKITDTHSNSQWPLWIPKTDCVEKNIVDLLTKKCRNFRKTADYVRAHYQEGSVVERYSDLVNNKCLLLHKGSQYISDEDMPDNSVSLIITDPPYLEQVLYSEYMQLYYPFLGLRYNLEDEIVVSSAPRRNKDKEAYFSLLGEVFAVCAKKLRPGGYMCLFFHDSSLEVWSKLLAVLSGCGFRYVSQAHIKKTLTLKNIISPKKSLNGDAVLFFMNTKHPVPQADAPEALDEIEFNLTRQAKQLLRINGNLTTPELYDNGLMEMLIQNGWLKKLSEKYSSLVELFEKHLRWDTGTNRWQIGESG